MIKHFRFLLVAGLLVSQAFGGTEDSPSISTTGRSEGRIIEGEVAKFGEFPHQLYLIQNKTGEGHYCGAIIYESVWALTAAHCVNDYRNRPEVFTVFAGLLSLSQHVTGWEKDFQVSHIYVHSQFNNETLWNDIALIKIKGKFEFSDYVHPIELSKKTELEGARAIATGWGETHPSAGPTSASDLLLKVEMEILSANVCARGAPIFDEFTQICASFPGKSTCNGDSGGPLQVDGELVGITSYGLKNACDSIPSYFTKVSAFSPWIENIMSSH